MELTKIFTGMENGPEAIQDNFNTIRNNISDTGWTNTGMTYLNGAKANKGGGIFYRRVSLFGVGYFVELRGVAVAPSSAGSGYVVQLPQSITPKQVIFPTGKAINPDGRIYAWDYEASGNISIYYSYLMG